MDSVNCPIGSVLERFSPLLRVYVTAIAVRWDSDGAPLCRHHLVSLFMHGVRLRGLHALVSVPSWDLSIVLEGLSELPSELLE